jgi:hypothetical protein
MTLSRPGGPEQTPVLPGLDNPPMEREPFTVQFLYGKKTHDFTNFVLLFGDSGSRRKVY